MAKKKRKTSGGGAFGKSVAKRLPRSASQIEEDEGIEVDRDRLLADHERRAAVLCRLFRSMTGKSNEEMNEFANSIFDLGVEEFLERYDPDPEVHFRAIKHLEERSEEDSEESLRLRVKEALAIDPDCADAHRFLTELASDPDVIVSHCRDAVAAGRRKHEAMLEAAGDGPPDPAMEVINRPYLEALHDLADYLWLQGDRDDSRLTYEALLELDPDDLRDVVPALIALAFLREDLEEVSSLLDSAHEQVSASVRYGRALLAFQRAMEDFPDFVPDMESSEPFGALKSPKMGKARELLWSAIQASPWAIPFVLDPRVILLRPMLVYTIGDPFDALEFARLNFSNWTAQGIPALWLVSEFGSERMSHAIERRLRRHHLAFLEALDLLEEIEPPELDDDAASNFFAQFFSISQEISEMMEDAGASPKGRRFRR